MICKKEAGTSNKLFRITRITSILIATQLGLHLIASLAECKCKKANATHKLVKLYFKSFYVYVQL